jgi:hypothetical protein
LWLGTAITGQGEIEFRLRQVLFGVAAALNFVVGLLDGTSLSI